MAGNNDGLTAEVLARLAAPFPEKAVTWKVQSVSRDKTKAMLVAYIDARDVAQRLDEVVAGDWAFDWVDLSTGDVQGRLTVCGVTRCDVGERSERGKTLADGRPAAGDTWKAAVSDALKRSAVLFGVGRYLYRLPRYWVDYDAGQRRVVGKYPRLPEWARGQGDGYGAAAGTEDEEEVEPLAVGPQVAAATPGDAAHWSKDEEMLRAFWVHAARYELTDVEVFAALAGAFGQAIESLDEVPGHLGDAKMALDQYAVAHGKAPGPRRRSS